MEFNKHRKTIQCFRNEEGKYIGSTGIQNIDPSLIDSVDCFIYNSTNDFYTKYENCFVWRHNVDGIDDIEIIIDRLGEEYDCYAVLTYWTGGIS